MKNTIKVKRGKFNLEFDTDKVTNKELLNTSTINITVKEDTPLQVASQDINPKSIPEENNHLALKLIISFIAGFILCVILYSLIYDQEFIAKVIKIFK